MAIILDSDVIIRGERGTFDLDSWIARRPDEDFALAAITVAELWHGIERATAPNRARRIEYLEDIVETLAIIPYTEQTAYEHARIWARLEAAGKLIGAHDQIIAATAIEHNFAVASFNERHFSNIRGLKLVLPE